MLHEITDAVPHPNHTVTITWADGAQGVVDFAPFIRRGDLFAASADPDFFVRRMTILHGGIGLSWPDELDFSADGLRRDALPDKETRGHGGQTASGSAPSRARRRVATRP